MSAARPSWGAAWRDVLDGAGASGARRVQRGQALARRGAVEELALSPGRVSAVVAEDRSSPYQVELSWPVADEGAWDRGVAALRAELRFTAALLEGELPEDLAEVLGAVGIDLVPDFHRLHTSCSCPERAKLCPHAAAVHAATAAIVERDPVVLLQLAGRSHEALLAELRRGATDGDAFVDAAIDLSRGLEAAHGDLDTIGLHPSPVVDPASLLRHLGDPPGVDDPEPIYRLVERAAAGAWRLAAGDGAAAADEALLLAELRAQRVASAASLADALGRDVDVVVTELDALFARGEVMRTGSGARARYRAASS